MTSPIEALKKAHQATAITRDSYSLENFVLQEGVKGIATMTLKAVQSKFVPSQAKENGSQGFRTRFVLDDGQTVGTFSNGAHQFFVFFSQIMGYAGDENFLNIEIDGEVQVAVSVLPLDDKKKTYNFEIVGGDFKGLSDYRPDLSQILALEAGANTQEAPPETKTEPEPENESETKPKK